MTTPSRLRWTTCFVTGKHGFHTRTDAQTARRTTPGGPHGIYRCQHCDLWHLGTKAGLTRQQHRGQGQPELITLDTAIARLRARDRDRMAALLIRCITEGRVRGECLLDIWFIHTDDLDRLITISRRDWSQA